MISHEKVSAWNDSRLLLRTSLCGAGAGGCSSSRPSPPPPSSSPQQLSHPVIGSDRNTNLQVEASNQASHGVFCFGHLFAGARSRKDERTATGFLRDAPSMHHLWVRRAKPSNRQIGSFQRVARPIHLSTTGGEKLARQSSRRVGSSSESNKLR